jgi:hypothetical protein
VIGGVNRRVTSVSSKCPDEPHSDLPLWRYMDLAKFLSLLQSSALFFCRLDLLEDQFEGQLPRGKERFRPTDYADSYDFSDKVKVIGSGAHILLKSHGECCRMWAYVNCWHMSTHESAAMWAIYGTAGQSIAIETTFERLKNCLPPNASLRPVQYIDYERNEIPLGDDLVFFLKRESFRHEAEVRALILDLESMKTKRHGNRLKPRGKSDPGMNVPVEIDRLVCKIHVGPKAQDWFFEVVKTLVQSFRLRKPVVRSSLDAPTLK